MEDQLDAEIRRYEHALKIYKRLDKIVSVALGACSVGSLVLTSGTLGLALTGLRCYCLPSPGISRLLECHHRHGTHTNLEAYREKEEKNTATLCD